VVGAIVLAACSTAPHSAKTIFQASDLRQRISLADAERQFFLSMQPAGQPFIAEEQALISSRRAKWNSFTTGFKEGDQVWTVLRVDPTYAEEGYAIVRNGEIVAAFRGLIRYIAPSN
jgi:hypothetical protein